MGWAFVTTSAILLAIKFTIGLRVSEQEEQAGLDISQHAEEAYSGGTDGGI
jgi:Amt family ammonium transporter